jgi:tungstate transport system substrate-binding protein
MHRRMTSWAAVVLIGLSAFGPSVSTGAEDVLVLATTTSTENSGLLAHLHPDFQRKTGIRVKVIAKGTGASLQLARDGNADIVLVHAPQLERQFIADGHGLARHEVMYNDFVIVGPKADPANLASAKSAAQALARVAAAKQAFISRGDGSGTHVKEQDLWRQTDLSLESKTVTLFSKGKRREITSVRPGGPWYLSIGQGMGKTIIVATEKQAYTLADRGTYYAFALAKPARTDLVILYQGGDALFNPYGVIAVNPAKHPHVNRSAAESYVRWITSAEVQKMIAQYKAQGKVLFHPHAAGKKER